MAEPSRQRLPNRRPTLTEAVTVGAHSFIVSVGLDPASGRVREIFMDGAKEGTDLAAILGDAAVVISVALQHGVPAEALGVSVARLPTRMLAPPYIGEAEAGASPAATIIGAALDLVRRIEAEAGHG